MTMDDRHQERPPDRDEEPRQGDEARSEEPGPDPPAEEVTASEEASTPEEPSDAAQILV